MTCRQHRWLDATCLVCGRVRDEARSRRGRTNRARGNALERDWCRRLGFRRVGHYGGPEDGIALNGMFVGQAKSLSTARFPGWMATELDRLPRSEGRIPVLGLIEAPGIGHRPRRLIVMEESDFIALHGPVE
jgi:hypothetical protein